MLNNKGSQIKMPLASTFNWMAQKHMLSKDQLLLIQKSAGFSGTGSNIKYVN
jgi:hypothetical protein